MSPHSRRFAATKPAILTAAALAAVLTLASCSSGAADDAGAKDAAGGSTGQLKVVTTTTQLTDFASEVGGDDATVTGLLQPGASAHHFDPTPADLQALGAADVLIVNGAGLDEFVDDAIVSSGFDGTTITAAYGVHLDEESEGEHDEHAEDEHGEDEHDHDHGGVNPHIWTSPHNAVGIVDTIAAGLAKAAPDHAKGFEERAAAYTAKLDALDTWVHDQFEQVPEADRKLVSGHDALHYYLEDYDIEFVGSILPSFDDNAEPSAAEVDELVAKIKKEGVKAIFVESSLSPKLAQTIARESGAKVVDGETLFVDSLGTKDSDGDTYIDATVHNTRVILEAWGFEPKPLPESLATS